MCDLCFILRVSIGERREDTDRVLCRTSGAAAMSVGKNSLLCFKNNSRSFSIASIGRWRDEDSFFEDADQKNGDVEETRYEILQCDDCKSPRN